MTSPSTRIHDPAKRLRWPLRLTLLGLVAERGVRAFWPLWAVLLTVVSVAMLGLLEQAPVELYWGAFLCAALAGVSSLWWALRRFRWPSRAEAEARLDASLSGRPIAALRDAQAIGAGDAGSEQVWAAHRARMAARLTRARAVVPDLHLSRFDRYGLRYTALTLFAIALLFGSALRLDPTHNSPVAGPGTVIAGPSWEGWLTPPAYTGRPSLYLNDLPPGPLDLPAGTRIDLRLYGTPGDLAVSETVSGRTGELDSAAAPSQAFEVTQPGDLAILGEGGAEWTISLTTDAPPQVALEGPLDVKVDGEFSQPFAASDDYGVETGEVEFALDLAAVPRSFGLAADPDPREPVIAALPMPITGGREDFAEVFVEDLSKHPWAGLPVMMTFRVSDAAGNEGASDPQTLTLPARRFFEPLAQALIEQRRDLLWARANAPRVAQLLRAISHRPEGLFQTQTDYLRVRTIARALEASAPADIDQMLQEDMAETLWELALKIEEGDLSDAMARLRRAQEKLAEAMRDGASDSEIDQLMQELREAMQDVMRQLAQQQRDSDQERQFAEGQEITGQQLEDLLDRLQQLMQEGRMAEAQQLLDQIARMMQNMQMAQGQPGGQGSQGQQALNGLRETLRDQQNLSDDSFQGLQGQQPGRELGQGQGQPGQGQNGQPGGENGPSQGTEGLAQDLADRQQALRDTLRNQQQSLPGTGEGSDAAREALEGAGRAMEEAEDALRRNDLAGAMDSQSEAMDRLRDGIRDLGRELAQEQPGQGPGGEQLGETAPGNRLDPLGREATGDGQFGTRERLLQNEDVYRRARDLLDEIRRRSGDQTRPEVELDYLRRLLDRF
ncbi:TIGR02302 family protein [Fluviibacterium sp. DFM31]|uniref:TIGR02302 family protein n=1 Tax=Meridianimarinicoccus marinus TaxID=3231483 RepID=A0ABV3L2E5_9RHOB